MIDVLFDEYKNRLENIINISFGLLEKKIKSGSVISKNETSFQLELGHILKTVGNLYEFSYDEKFHLEMERTIHINTVFDKSKSQKARIDIYLEFGNSEVKVKSAIELKFFKKENHREPNNRYDVFSDLSNLEKYRENGIDLCYFYLYTNHSHYVNQKNYSLDTRDFDFRDGKGYIANTELIYNTVKPYKEGRIILKNNYSFNWKELRSNLFFLMLKI